MPDYETILAVIETGIDADNRAFYAEALEELRRWKGGGGTIFAATTAEIIKLEYAIRFRPAWVRLSVALTSPRSRLRPAGERSSLASSVPL
jgi:hypothetical protein